MLLDHFYSSEPASTTDDINWTVRVLLHAEHAIYQGHFPQQPVVPGVCLLQIIKECAEQIKGEPLQYTQVNSCKFLSALHPGQTPELLFTLTFKQTEENKFILQSEGKAGEFCFIKLKATLTNNPWKSLKQPGTNA